MTPREWAEMAQRGRPEASRVGSIAVGEFRHTKSASIAGPTSWQRAAPLRAFNRRLGTMLCLPLMRR